MKKEKMSRQLDLRREDAILQKETDIKCEYSLFILEKIRN